jgi:pyrroline-5-carboxylate reductase
MRIGTRMLKEKIGFIGAGRMGSVLIRSILEKGLVSSKNLWVCDRIPEKLSFFSKRGVNTSLKIKSMIKRVDVIFIAVKPQDISEVLENLKNKIQPSQLIVTIVAGITTSYIRQKLSLEIPVVRVMPNAPASIGEGISAISPSRDTNMENIKIVKEILGAAGEIIEVSEQLQDAVTGLSGSGPAYIYTFLQALIEGGIKAGLSEEVASRLAIQTTLGAAKMAKESGISLDELRRAVVSPGGTTSEGLKVLEKGGFKSSLIQAVIRGTEKARELRR